jgi:hypothetical protein
MALFFKGSGRPPFPLGHPLEDADPALLDPVKARAPFWRPA